MKSPAADNLASWENEGGATAPAPNVVQPVARPGYAEDAPRRTRKGGSDTHTLALTRVSLLLLIPAVGTLAVFWGLLAGHASQ